MVHSERLHQFYTLLHSTRVGGCTKSTKAVVIGIALEKNLIAVELEAEVGS